MGYYRYKMLISGDGTMNSMPKIKINKRQSDKYVLYHQEKTRLDRIAGEMYSDDTFWWLILLANPEYFSEFDIPTNTRIRIPFPLNDVLSEFQDKINQNKNLA